MGANWGPGVTKYNLDFTKHGSSCLMRSCANSKNPPQSQVKLLTLQAKVSLT
ncbi:hypothetical protein B7P43_G16640 [Cryptotermes secundus]|uniref:Uncharacterized protein n=1 Tax=Cryptotermes secundus TaxID=105785 RepID=A0A2J7Q801_9NEOP|nr:hypothetical protein B7P43_G16640 [Cryptotermes secundus]